MIDCAVMSQTKVVISLWWREDPWQVTYRGSWIKVTPRYPDRVSSLQPDTVTQIATFSNVTRWTRWPCSLRETCMIRLTCPQLLKDGHRGSVWYWPLEKGIVTMVTNTSSMVTVPDEKKTKSSLSEFYRSQLSSEITWQSDEISSKATLPFLWFATKYDTLELMKNQIR